MTYFTAAFRRLCVETILILRYLMTYFTAAFRRLCVETTSRSRNTGNHEQPPSGGCVLKLYLSPETGDIGHSRLQAAVC